MLKIIKLILYLILFIFIGIIIKILYDYIEYKKKQKELENLPNYIDNYEYNNINDKKYENYDFNYTIEL